MTTQAGRIDRWPQALDYNVAIQAPAICFRDSELRDSLVERHPVTRMPKLWTGGFADVYRLRRAGELIAVKCFKRSSGDVNARYVAIADALATTALPYFVDFRFLHDEMLVNGSRYPVVKMRWAGGTPLHDFVRERLAAPESLRGLASNLVCMVRRLEENGLAHGDLQHGNILVDGGSLTLVDYDGLFVPGFAGSDAPEIGLPNYQHPQRSTTQYGPGIDRFPLVVLCAGLHALASDPSLWESFNPVDTESFLFSRDDFLYPDESRLVARLRRTGDGLANHWLETLLGACAMAPDAVPFPEVPEGLETSAVARPIWAGEESRLSPTSRPWWVSIQSPASDSRVVDRAFTPPQLADHGPKPSLPQFDEIETGPRLPTRKFAAAFAVLAVLVFFATGWVVPGGVVFFTVIVSLGVAALRWSSLVRAFPPAQLIVGLIVVVLLSRLVPVHLFLAIVVTIGSFLADRYSKWKNSASSKYGWLKSRSAELAASIQRIDMERRRIEGEILSLNRAELNEKSSSLLYLRTQSHDVGDELPRMLPAEVDRSITVRYRHDRDAKTAELASLNHQMTEVLTEQRLVTVELDVIKQPTFLDFVLARGGSST